MIRRLLQLVHMPVSGYETITVNTRPDGYHEIFLYPYGTEQPERQEKHHVADCNTRDRVIRTELFDTLGVSYLTAGTEGILVMDEIGFMESGAEIFCHTILEKLDGELPILAAVREGMETDFLSRVKSHPSARVIRMEPERFEDIYEELKPIVLGWEKQYKERGKEP